MSRYAALKTLSYRNCEERLAVLRHEMLVPIAKIQGYTELLIKQFDQNVVSLLPEDFKSYIEQIAQAGDEINEILEVLTGDQE